MEAKEQARFLAQAEDRLRRTSRSGRIEYLYFADPAMRANINCQLLPRYPDCQILWEGGYPGAERQAAALWRDDPVQVDLPICALSFEWDARYGTPEHRDILGSLLGCGITRERLGDIVLAQGQGWCVVSLEIADYLIANWDSAGRVRLRKVSKVDFDQIQVQQEPVKVIRDTVLSLRLDAVLASAFQVSRNIASEWVKAGRVKVNWVECMKTDRALAQGDWLSVRGKGRAQLYEVGNRSQKGRTWVELHRLGEPGARR
ncbi:MULTISPECIES: YlmH/Sll1252 family protein [unclassified Clostridium]|uniref:YlmH family RNA-binding protein n=1 Tax=unclassified Clostridium TaxID=2614128 RepID=UPI001105B22B|nr:MULTISPECIES: YlmH/Sll1252 family protein [unclassified Clostridium]